MSNEQRAHDLTMFYLKLLCDFQQPNQDNEIELDPYSKYLEIYPTVLEKVNRDFSNI